MKIGLYGHTENENYGGCLTYYALGKVIENLGYDLTIIPRSLSVTEEDTNINAFNENSPSVKFFAQNFKMAERLPYERFTEYNKLADTFVLGSDMIWKDKQYRWARDTFYLNFLEPNKRKIAYATSFGTDKVEQICDKERMPYVLDMIRSFDKISVREDWACNFLKSNGIPCNHVIDPIFMLDSQDYLKLAENIECNLEKDFTLAYLVDIKKLKDARSIISEKNIPNSELVMISDGHISSNKKIIERYSEFLTRPSIEQFLWYFAHAKFIVTDSFHGVCMCLIFNKPFVWIARNGGNIRIQSLSRQLGINIVSGEIFHSDWNIINNTIKRTSELGRIWLNSAINEKYDDN